MINWHTWAAIYWSLSRTTKYYVSGANLSCFKPEVKWQNVFFWSYRPLPSSQPTFYEINFLNCKGFACSCETFLRMSYSYGTVRYDNLICICYLSYPDVIFHLFQWNLIEKKIQTKLAENEEAEAVAISVRRRSLMYLKVSVLSGITIAVSVLRKVRDTSLFMWQIYISLKHKCQAPVINDIPSYCKRNVHVQPLSTSVSGSDSISTTLFSSSLLLILQKMSIKSSKCQTNKFRRFFLRAVRTLKCPIVTGPDEQKHVLLLHPDDIFFQK